MFRHSAQVLEHTARTMYAQGPKEFPKPERIKAVCLLIILTKEDKSCQKHTHTHCLPTIYNQYTLMG